MEWIYLLNDQINSIVWGPPFMVLLLGTGLYLTIRLGGIQFRYFRLSWQESFGRLFHRDREHQSGSITSFQAVSSAMAATIGVGNIAGVSTAIALGGPGAVFWMWVTACIGMATKFGEAALGLKFRHVDRETGEVSGGVMYYIEYGLGKRWKWLAVTYGLLAGLAALGIGCMVQANTAAHALETAFGIHPIFSGIAIILLVGIVILGGIRRIAHTAEAIVPIMCLIYVLACLFVIAINIQQIGWAFAQIFHYAFRPAAAQGGFTGAAVSVAIRFGIARGIFSNEAGLGASSIVHAQARNTPVRQGMWAIWETFIDTIIVCTMTALVVILSGAIETGFTGARLISNAFDTTLPSGGGLVVLVGLVLFAYTTMLTWSFYGEKCWAYIFGNRIVLPYRLLFIGFLYIGAIGGLTLVWDLADTLNGLMAIPNLIALLALAGILVKEKQNYLQSR